MTLDTLNRSDSIDKSNTKVNKAPQSNFLVTKEQEKSKNILTLLEIYNQEEEKSEENKRKISFKYNDSDSEDETPTKKVARTQKGKNVKKIKILRLLKSISLAFVPFTLTSINTPMK